MAFNFQQRLMSLSVATPTAKELAVQIGSGVYNWQRLMWCDIPETLAKYLAASLENDTFDPVKATEYGMIPAVALLIKNGQYETEASALFARMTSKPNAPRRALINNTYRLLKEGGVFSRLDSLYVLAAHDAQSARLNWVSNQFNLTLSGSPTFISDRGYQGDGLVTYLASGFNPTTSGGKFSQNDASMSVWSRSDVAENGRDIGNSNSTIASRIGTGGLGTRGNVAATQVSSISPDSAIGFSGWSRSSAANYQPYKNGAALTPITIASAALVNEDFRILSGVASLSSKQIAVGSWGQSLTNAQMSAFYSAMQSYLQAVGAA